MLVVGLLYWLYRSPWSALNRLLSNRLLTTFFQVAFQPSPWRTSAPWATIAPFSLSVRASASASSSAIMARTLIRSRAVLFSSWVLILLPPSILGGSGGGVGLVYDYNAPWVGCPLLP